MHHVDFSDGGDQDAVFSRPQTAIVVVSEPYSQAKQDDYKNAFSSIHSSTSLE